MRILLFADLHLDAPFTWAPPAVARARRQALRDALSHIGRLAAELDVEALCCAGDLFEHERTRPDTGRFLREVFAAAPCPVLLAPGNHDWYGPASLYRQVDWPGNVQLFTADRLEAYELSDGFTVWGAAHRAPANTDGFLDGFRADRGGVSVALFHGSEQGGLVRQGDRKVPHAPFEAEQVPRAGLAHALVGHFHRPVSSRWHTYPGNPEPLAFGETGQRGAVLVTVAADGSVARETFEVWSAPWRDVTVELEDAEHVGQIREQVRAALAGLDGIVRLTISGAVAPGLDLSALDVSDLGLHLDALVVRPPQVSVRYDVGSLAAEATVRGAFVRDVLAADLPADTCDRVLRAGLLAFDGRVDEMVAG